MPRKFTRGRIDFERSELGDVSLIANTLQSRGILLFTLKRLNIFYIIDPIVLYRIV